MHSLYQRKDTAETFCAVSSQRGERKIKNFGEVLKYIRTSKNMTQEELSKGIMSRSNISRFEKGNYEVSFTKFIQLLNRLAVTFEEYLYIYNGYSTNKAEQLYAALVEAENTAAIKRVKEISQQAYQEMNAGNLEYELTFFTAENVLFKSNQSTTLNFSELKDYVQKHLVKADNWFLQDFRILNNFLVFFETTEVVYFANRAIVEFKKYDKISLKNNVAVHFMLNAGTILFDRGEVKQAKKYFMYTKEQGITQQKLLPVILAECYLSLIASQLETQTDADRECFIAHTTLLNSWGYHDLSDELKAKLDKSVSKSTDKESR